MLTIAIDTTCLTSQPSGIGLYVYNLVHALYSLQASQNFQLRTIRQTRLKNIFKRDVDQLDYLNLNIPVSTIPIPVSVINTLVKFPNPLIPYYEQFLGSPNIVHGTDYFVYPCAKSLNIMSLHDLTFIKYPSFTNFIVRTYTSRIQQSLKWTDLVITISENTKKDIINYLNIPEEKVYVTPLASRYNASSFTLELSEKLAKSKLYDFSKPYLLFVSTIEPRKNINTLITAFNYLKETYKIAHQLILIGKKGWSYEPIFAAIKNSPWRNEIHHLDYLSDDLVAFFYSKADVFVYPSYYEGFGMPVLEAMTLGAPVVTSNSSSIPEVTGDAAILIDPNEPMQLAEAILQVISDSQLRQELIAQGKERAKLFSWEKTAKLTLEAYRSIV
ncbi:glycosyltransferase family 1 protein [Nostoc sp. FACHB-110]|uniref:glycosyltransferase family 4 protein n=1 Tax=Nostoc sp. FACHB-110 TaxID=2692834 RepID=UPI00168893C7|nr:glycosyltransferase family 1 protein [Nostoc sp. FACHB-110]MBD2436131.1 glycosyltransferase family 4 protein [Nostoc sp. FACHB-110]